MSGWRTLGSSTGSASKTISDRAPVGSTTSSAISSRRHLVGVADVHRLVHVGLGEQDQAADQVVDEAEAAGLRAVAEHRERLSVSAWLMNAGMARPSLGRIRGP